MNPLIRRPGLTFALVALILLNCMDSFSQQTETGFYIIMQAKKKNCPNNVHGRNETQIFCLTKEPVLRVADFEKVGDVQYDSLLQEKYLMLRLTADGYNTLKVLMAILPDTRLALVIENTVAGTYEHPSSIMSRSLPIRGRTDATEIDWIYSALKKEKP